MADFAELAIETIDRVVDKHGDVAYDKVQVHNPLSSHYKQDPTKLQSQQQQQQQQQQQGSSNIGDDRQSTRSNRRSRDRPRQHRHTVDLPSPERDEFYSPNNDRDYDRRSETSERVLRSYENERDDPPRRYPNRMSHGYDDRRPSSQGAARSRYDDDDSDYDEQSGRRHRPSGRGYETDRRETRDRDRDYDREIVETEVYRGPPRDWGNQRSPSFQEDNGEYAVAQYRGGNGGDGAVAGYDNKRRSRSYGRRDKDRDEYSDRDRSRSREHDGIRGKLEDTFDTTPRGLGAGLLGAVVGGLAGRQFGDKRNNKRDMAIGAVVGGLAVNAAENKFREWKQDRDEEKLGGGGERYDDRGYRSRSAMR